ncbi:MAG: ABC transporter permease subunit [Phycisphaerae bacterium]|nr:ABC transporter permease subunit [Phycisphaerae bacterium]
MTILRPILLLLGVAIWACLVVVPLAGLVSQVSLADLAEGLALWWSPVAARSVGLAAMVAAMAVALGLVPAWLMATASRRWAGGLTVLALASVLLPQYVLYYSWAICLSPTAALGQYVAADRTLAEWAAWISSSFTLVLWYWPLAALLLAQGWRNIPAEVHDAAALDARPLARLRYVAAPLMTRPAALAAGLCFALCLADFASLHLAGQATIGTELALAMQQSLRVGPAVAGCVPLAAMSLLLAVALARSAKGWADHTGGGAKSFTGRPRRWAWTFVTALLLFTLAGPLALLAGTMSPHYLAQFVTLQADKYVQSLAVSALGAGVALLLARIAWDTGVSRGEGVSPMRLAGILPTRSGKGGSTYSNNQINGTHNAGETPASRCSRPRRIITALIAVSLLVVAIIPGGLVAVAMSQWIARYEWLLPLRDSVLLVSLFQGVRFAGLALIVFWAVRDARSRSLAEAAAVDGASPWQAWRHVHLPATWPTLAGAAVVVLMLGLTEITGSQIVSPPGAFSLSLYLLNQMHALRDQEVVAACLLLFGFYLAAAIGLWLLLRLARRRRSLMTLLLIVALSGVSLPACSRPHDSPPDVRGKIGRRGSGNGELLYPRAIDRFADGTLVVVDKTGRVQLLSPDGGFVRDIAMPDIVAGKPCGVSVGPDGNIYVADTHCHRVMVFSRDGELVRQWGSFGEGDGQFIFPTDIAFLPDGRVLVSEYGANDRINLFTPEGKFLGAFGSFGPEAGQFSRPQSMAVDAARDRLYVTDACNHRVAVYNLRCELQGYIGSPGSGPGQLRYPYGLALTRDGRLVVVEQGNNRVQIFTPDGQAIASLGSAGRELGQLSYPWAVAIDDDNMAYVVDGGNDRVQVWKLP